ncbi:ATP-grasp domain-containing protein [Clostridiaceae bacterium UIB06]|uniref:ATP-grasp domain-containing protein n=1 Tax=Clostridium thailandense TaxID=2794346 RepID=A0A949TU64_9CLOT|nr:ATP-grasp domain-containing protein [Clostridium thailandense]MBV7272453.1 ATP-grasp domain-containing protein [Clostridium thailandense]MCH5136977.1 ATP-grasp domain-containing protein [Clostridiaceae bacterium UIB06]
MNRKMNIAVVHGGTSSESAISTQNAGYIAKSLEENGHVVSLLEFDESIYTNLQKSRPQLVFIAVQGKYHGDGTMQSICEHLRLPYTGSKATAAAIINDKCICKKVCACHGIRTPEFIYVNKQEFFSTSKEELLEEIEKVMPYPVVAKAITQGGSYGIEYIQSREDYEKIAQTFKFDDEIIIERFIKGKFVTTSILEIEKVPTALPTLLCENLIGEQEELVLCNKRVTAKEAEISAQLKKELEKVSIDVFKIFNAKNYARIDYMLEEKTKIPYFIEINAVPGLTPDDSFFPQAAEKYGISLNNLVEIIVENEL